MNMQRSIFTITFILSVLLNNTLLFSMKRQWSEISSYDESDYNLKSLMVVPSLDEYIQYIDKVDHLDKMRKISMPDVNALDDKSKILPTYRRLSILNKLDKSNKKHIDNEQYKRLLGLCNFANNEGFHAAKQYIVNDLKRIKYLLHKNEIDAQNELARAYNIDIGSERWATYMMYMRARIEAELAAMKRPWHTTAWSVDLPENVKDAFIKVFEEHQLNPTALNIMPVLAEKLNCTQASYESPKLVEKEGSFGYEAIEPSCIRFNPDIAQESYEYLTYVANHEVAHGLNGHATKANYLVRTIRLFTKVKCKDIMLHPAYTKFRLAIEIAADASHALKDAEIARCARSIPYLYAGSYQVIAAIDTNWKVLKVLESKK